MKKISVLVTAVGGDIGDNIVKCLQDREPSLTIYGSDMDPYAFGRVRVKEFFCPTPAVKESEYAAFLAEIIKQKKIRYIFPSSEAEIEYFHRNRAKYLSQNVHVMINNPLILDNFSDKYQTSLFLKDKGVDFPRTFLLNEYNNQLPFPVLIKKRKSSGSKIVLIVNNPEEMQFYRKKYLKEDLIVQEYIGHKDEEYTIGVFSDGKNTHCIGLRRYLASDAGITRFAELVYDPEINALGCKVAQLTGLEGCLNIQVRKTDKGFIPFEINPRISGTSYIRHYFGFKDVQWWLDMKEGRPIQYVPKFERGFAVRAVREVFLDLEEKECDASLPLDFKIDKWDSYFFKRKIARLRITEPVKDFSKELERLVAKVKKDKARFFIVKSVCDKTMEKVFLKYGFKKYGISIDLAFDKEKAPPIKFSENVPIRPYQSEDLPAIRTIAKDGFRWSYFYKCGFGDSSKVDQYYPQWIENLSNDPDCTIFVAEEKGRVVGFNALKINRETQEGRIVLIATDTKSREKGIGRALVRASLYNGPEYIRKLYAMTQMNNIKAIEFYHHMGFKDVRKESIFCIKF